jgi:hypothetical protein
MESENLRKRILDELIKFQRMIYDYECEDLDEDDRIIIFQRIKSNLKESSEYAAFKRWMIRDVEGLREIFKEYV